MMRRPLPESTPRARLCTLLVMIGLALAHTGCGPDAMPVPAAPTVPNQGLSEDSPARPFVGSYAHVGGDSERAAVDKAIEEGIATLSPPLVRGVARSRLNAANKVPKQLVFLAYDGWFEVQVDGRRYAARADGSPYKVETSTGDVMDLRYKFGSTLEQSFSDPAKARVNTFELKDNRLIMHVRVSASLLPKDITYTLTFERAAEPPPAAASVAAQTPL